MRSRRHALLAAAGALAAAAAIGCGSDEEGGATTTTLGDASSGETARADLDVRIDPGQDGGEPQSFRIFCGDAQTDDDPRACNRLDALAAALEDPPPDQACTQIFGGPQTATITGTLNGEPVEVDLARTNGCEIATWDDVFEILGIDAAEGQEPRAIDTNRG